MEMETEAKMAKRILATLRHYICIIIIVCECVCVYESKCVCVCERGCVSMRAWIYGSHLVFLKPHFAFNLHLNGDNQLISANIPDWAVPLAPPCRHPLSLSVLLTPRDMKISSLFG